MIIVGGDPKTCFDTLNSSLSNVEWSISSFLHCRASKTDHNFDSCAFGWVRRDGNCVVDSLC